VTGGDNKYGSGFGTIRHRQLTVKLLMPTSIGNLLIACVEQSAFTTAAAAAAAAAATVLCVLMELYTTDGRRQI